MVRLSGLSFFLGTMGSLFFCRFSCDSPCETDREEGIARIERRITTGDLNLSQPNVSVPDCTEARFFCLAFFCLAPETIITALNPIKEYEGDTAVARFEDTVEFFNLAL